MRTVRGFIEKQFTCAICGDTFKALTGAQSPTDVVCMSCGVKYSAEKQRKLIDERKARQRRR